MLARPLLLPLVLVAGCKPSPPNFTALCAPNEARSSVECAAKNWGERAGRACITAMQTHRRTGKHLLSKRTCTNSLAPGESAQFPVVFPDDVVAFCFEPSAGWVCRGSVVENNVQAGENIPGE